MKKILIPVFILIAFFIAATCSKKFSPATPIATQTPTPNMTATAQAQATLTVVFLQTAGPSAQATATAQAQLTANAQQTANAQATLTATFTPPGVPPGYSLYWSDEFNGPVGSYPSASNWAPQTGDGGWGNNELENYTNSTTNAQIVSDSNAIDGRALAITVIDTMPGNPNYSTVGRYTSARLQTLGLQSFQYGYMVARIRLPFGQGIWPAFWMLGTDINSAGWPACGEIDIMENIGNTADQPINHGSLHDGTDWSNTYTLPGGQLFHNDYHVFGVLWQAGEIQFYVDGNLYETVKSSQEASGAWKYNNSFFFLLNVAAGGNWPGSPDATTSFPQVMYVDYVRVYIP